MGWAGGSKMGLARWLLAGLCSLDLLLLVSSPVLLPLWSLQRFGVELVAWGWCLLDGVCFIPQHVLNTRSCWVVEPKNSSQVGFVMDLDEGGQ